MSRKAEEKPPANCIGRRGFLKSLFGVTAAAEASATAAHRAPSGRWLWADLRTGQIGFPSGLSIGSALPGSLMKLIAAAAFSEEALVTPNETVECRGTLVLGKRRITCQSAHGFVNLPHAIGQSCNIYFAKMSTRLSASVFMEYARRFGLSQPVAKQASGRFPLKYSSDSLEYVLGLADDLVPTALQILQISALIGTRGHLVYLHSADEPKQDAPAFLLKLSDSTWTVLIKGMQLAVQEGTAKKLDPENKMQIAAKTGTSERGVKFQSWITGFFPVDKPHYAFCLLAPTGTSADAAVPAARQFLLSTTWP